MRIAFLTTDNRDAHRRYGDPVPCFGTAPTALLEGFAMLGGGKSIQIGKLGNGEIGSSGSIELGTKKEEPRTTPVEPRITNYGLETAPPFEIHVISCTQQPLRAPEKLASNIWYHSLHVPKIGWLRTGYQGCIRAVRRKLREIDPDIVHGQGTERDCAMSAVFSGYPNLLTIHGNHRLIARLVRAKAFSFLWLAARLESLCLGKTDGVVCLSRHTQQAVLNLAKKTWILPNAVDSGFFHTNRRSLSCHPPLVICVGTICPWKNQNALIRALDPLAESKGFRLVFAGKTDGNEYSDEFRELIRSRAWCEHLNFIDREATRGLFERASVLVHPSLEDNCPMVVLEAMASGVPVVASRVGGIPDLICDGIDGFLCDPRDMKSFVFPISSLLESESMATAMSDQARDKARTTYHPSVIAGKHLEIYSQLLKKAS